MKKSKILVIVLSLALLIVGVFAGTTLVAGASSVTESDWVAAPTKTLVKCAGGECKHTAGECDYVYSFAVVGDTQNLNYIDAQNYVAALAKNPELTYATYTEAHMRTLYNWILNNKDSKNIQYVMGLGDITQSFNVNQTYYDEEWSLVKEAISLLDGKLGYSLVRGNHDISSGMNGAFGVGNRYYNDLVALAETNDSENRPMAGFLDAAKVEDTYRKIITSNGDKYIIFTLDYYPTEECLTWLDSVLEVNSDYTAIITVHAFTQKDTSLLDDIETTTPAEVTGQWVGTDTGGNVEPRVLWEEHLSKYANVKLILSGHIDYDNLVVNQLRGDNGNTVTAILSDAQTVDATIEPVGMVTMLYISADGKIMNVEYISTVREAAGKNAYLKQENQFEMTVDYGVDDADAAEENRTWKETPYGYIPAELYESYPFHVLLDDDGNNDTAPSYFGYYDTWGEVAAAVHAYNGIGGIETRKLKVWNVVVSKDCESVSGLSHNNFGKNPSKMVVDLMGNTFTVSQGHVMLPFYNQNSSFHSSVELTNGTVTLAKNSKIAVLQTAIKENGSVIDLTLSDLDIKVNSNTASIINHYPGYDYKSYVNLDVVDCTIDASAAGGATTLFELENTTYNNSDVTLTFNGTSIKGDTAANLTVATLNEGCDKVFYDADASGKYPTITLNESSADLSGVYRSKDGTLLQYKAATVSGDAYLYEMEVAPMEETSYGNIPTNTYPAETYPFVLFQNGEIIAAYTSWKEFCQNIYATDSAEDKNSVLYLRENHDSTEKASDQLRNVKYLTIDLGGNVLTGSGGCIFNLAAASNYDFTTNIKVTNGTLSVAKAWAPLISFNSSNTEDVDAKFNLTFDGVTVSSASGFSGRLLVEAWKDGTDGTTNTVTFNNCTIDATLGSVSSLFTLNESAQVSGEAVQNKVDVAININGGKLMASSYFTLGTFSAEREEGKGSPDTLTISDDFTLVMPSSVTHPTTGIATTKGALYPIETVDDGTNATYYFKSIKTKYGNIDTAYLSAVDYPFVLFKNGSPIHAAKSWYTLVQTDFVKNADFQTGATLLVRRDYDTTEGGKSSQNLYYIKDLTIDLDGHTVTRGSYHLFQAMEKHTTARRICITVKNGTLVSKGAPIISFNDNPNSTVISGYDFVFENVTFNLSAGKNLANCYTDGDEGMSNSITLNNCTVDLGSYTNTLTIFSLSESSGNKQDVAVTFNGGKIIANSLSNLTLAVFSPEREEGKGSPDSLKFGAYEGNYVSFVTKLGNTAPSYDFVTVNGSSASLADVSTASNAIYQLGEDLVTEYGNIPFAYTDAEKYPVIIFKDGEYFGNNTVFSAGYKAALAETDDSVDTVAVVLLRKSLTEELSASLSDGNLIKGTLIVDLGANTYTTNAKALFQFNAKNSANNPKIRIKNGRLNTIRLIAFANQTTAVCQQYDILFKDVTLGFTSGTWNSMISTNQTDSSDGYYALANLTFENCVFDLKSNQSFTSYKLLDLANDTNNHAVNATFKGGEFILGDYTFTLATIKSGYSDNTHFIEGGSDSDTVRFEKGAGGYPVLTLPSGAAAPTNVYDSTELTFVKVSDDGTDAVYTLMPAAAVSLDFTPKSSITLGSELTYNVYVPVIDVLKSYTIDGELYENAEVVTLEDGKSYYRIEVPMAASEAARNITLCATVTLDGKDYTGTFTMSIPKYARKVIESDASAEEIALIKDVLAYVRAAYVYFDSEGKDEALLAIDALLGDYSAELEKVVGNTNVEQGLKGVMILLEEKPAVRFVLPEGANIEDYTFSSGGKALGYTTGTYTEDGKDYTYAEVKLYAYQLIGEITYTDGTYSGSYHINSYYDFVTTDDEYKDNAALIDLVEKLYNYCKSAEAYRLSVVE